MKARVLVAFISLHLDIILGISSTGPVSHSLLGPEADTMKGIYAGAVAALLASCSKLSS